MLFKRLSQSKLISRYFFFFLLLLASGPQMTRCFVLKIIFLWSVWHHDKELKKGDSSRLTPAHVINSNMVDSQYVLMALYDSFGFTVCLELY